MIMIIMQMPCEAVIEYPSNSQGSHISMNDTFQTCAVVAAELAAAELPATAEDAAAAPLQYNAEPHGH